MQLGEVVEHRYPGRLCPGGRAQKLGSYIATCQTRNIMLRPDGYVKVLDFGIAKLSELKRGACDQAEEDADKRLGSKQQAVSFSARLTYMSEPSVICHRNRRAGR